MSFECAKVGVAPAANPKPNVREVATATNVFFVIVMIPLVFFWLHNLISTIQIKCPLYFYLFNKFVTKEKKEHLGNCCLSTLFVFALKVRLKRAFVKTFFRIFSVLKLCPLTIFPTTNSNKYYRANIEEINVKK
ncbi:hypothetical protein B7C51_21035 [Paenibacillus larvae subsp. pulvifaciens]|uniref:Uncharacterized protein n=1 Tax=Paenibacillus larvae subsp. pulvifaciens TaxID=1477 RepID=A0A1V0UXW3_9BACL|nr:hypothetical protein B7C51_21035 [Paenibacillus larvae subsp. pulvifaciens]